MSRRPPGFEVSSINSFNRSGAKGVPQMETEIGRNTSDVGDRAAELDKASESLKSSEPIEASESLETSEPVEVSKFSASQTVNSGNSFRRAGVKGVAQMETEVTPTPGYTRCARGSETGRNASGVEDCVAELRTKVDMSELVAGTGMQTSVFVETLKHIEVSSVSSSRRAGAKVAARIEMRIVSTTEI